MMPERFNRYYNIFFIIFIFYTLFCTVINEVFPLKFLGYSLVITVIPILLIVLIFLASVPFYTQEDFALLLILVLCVLIVFVLQNIFGINDRDILTYLVFHRYLFSCFILFSIFRKMDFKKYYIHYAIVFFISFAFSNVTSILYLFNLPTYRILSTKGEDVFYLRFGGIWGAPNGFSNVMFIFLAYFLFIFPHKTIFKYFVCILGFMGWIASGSRSVALYLLLILPFVIIPLPKLESSIKKYISSLVILGVTGICALIFSGLWNTLSQLEGAIQRMQEMGGSDIRSDKNLIYTNLIFSDVQNVMLGLSTKVQEGRLGQIDFSDNAILLLMIDNGVPFAVIFILILIYMYFNNSNRKISTIEFSIRKKFPYSVSLILLFLIFGLTSAMNNTIIWDFYLYTSMLIFFILRDPLIRLRSSIT